MNATPQLSNTVGPVAPLAHRGPCASGTYGWGISLCANHSRELCGGRRVSWHIGKCAHWDSHARHDLRSRRGARQCLLLAKQNALRRGQRVVEKPDITGADDVAPCGIDPTDAERMLENNDQAHDRFPGLRPKSLLNEREPRVRQRCPGTSDLPSSLHHCEMAPRNPHDTQARDALTVLHASEELWLREQGKPELSEEALMELEVPEDEAQS